jgi:hypothetical protein
MATVGMVEELAGIYSSIPTEKGERLGRVVGGIAGELVDRMVEIGGAQIRTGAGHVPGRGFIPFDAEIWKYVSDRMVLEAGAGLMFHSCCVDAITDGNKVIGVVVDNKSGRHAIFAKVTIDATGDGDIAAHAGVPFEIGNEGGKVMGNSLIFRLGGVDMRELDRTRDSGEHPARLGSRYPQVRELALKAVERGELPTLSGPWIHVGFRSDEVMVNSTTLYGDPTKTEDLTRMEIEGREHLRKLVVFFKNHVPGFQNCYVVKVAPSVSYRESRRIHGEYVLSGDDMKEGKSFEDGIAFGGFASYAGGLTIDIHPSEPGGEHIWERLHNGPTTIPYRCLIPRDFDNILTSGRCISADRKALGSIRVMATCMATGEAAGTAASLSAAEGILPRQVYVPALRDLLKKQGAILDREDIVFDA